MFGEAFKIKDFAGLGFPRFPSRLFLRGQPREPGQGGEPQVSNLYKKYESSCGSNHIHFTSDGGLGHHTPPTGHKPVKKMPRGLFPTPQGVGPAMIERKARGGMGEIAC